ncbi:MAG: SoxR reducing system RseC family protein [Methylococcaceae bacterium]|nr:SoxR reducing system RseC family protein [Methylococcaceae bacterium]
MIEELAVVVKIENHQVWVEAESNSACGGCQQKSSCTANTLGHVLKKKSVPVDSFIQLKTGDKVIVAIDEGLLLQASLLLYLLPLMALFTGAGIADWMLLADKPFNELWIAGSALVSFILSLWFINKAQYLLLLTSNRPVVVRKA